MISLKVLVLGESSVDGNLELEETELVVVVLGLDGNDLEVILSATCCTDFCDIKLRFLVTGNFIVFGTNGLYKKRFSCSVENGKFLVLGGINISSGKLGVVGINVGSGWIVGVDGLEDDGIENPIWLKFLDVKD